jgi:hypothetical protein
MSAIVFTSPVAAIAALHDHRVVFHQEEGQ